MAIEFNDATAKEAIASGKAVMIDFWAEWCGPCRRMAPIVEALAEEYDPQTLLVGKFDIEGDGCDELPVEYGIRSIPTLLLFKDGELKERIVGAQSREAILAKLSAIL